MLQYVMVDFPQTVHYKVVLKHTRVFELIAMNKCKALSDAQSGHFCPGTGCKMLLDSTEIVRFVNF